MPLTWSGRFAVATIAVQDSARRLSVVTSDRRKLSQNLPLHRRLAGRIPTSNRRNQFPTCQSTESLRHHCLLNCYFRKQSVGGNPPKWVTGGGRKGDEKINGPPPLFKVSH